MDQTPDTALAFPQAVLFDFDGTLVDSYPAITASVNHLRAQRSLPALPEDEVRRFVGRGPEYLLQNTVSLEHVEENLARYREHHPSVMLSKTNWLPGALKVVTTLKIAGRKVGLCSNKPRRFSEELLQHFDVRSHFDLVLGPEDVALPKPAPDMLNEALRRLDITPAEALYIGDMCVDIQTARAAGVAVWVVPTGSESEEALRRSGPDRMLSNLLEILNRIN